VVPLFFESHTPPPAEPTHSVLRSPDTPSMHAMRPLMMPGPSARARRPWNVSASSFQSDPLAVVAGFSTGFSAGFPTGWAAAMDADTAQQETASTNGRAHARAKRTAGMAFSLPG